MSADGAGVGGASDDATVTRRLQQTLTKNSRRLKQTVTEHAEYVYGEEKDPFAAQHGPAEETVQHLPRVLGADVLAAAVTSFVISPVVVCCDKAVCDAAVGRHTMLESVRDSLRSVVFRPSSFFGGRAFALVFGIYTLTYGTSNLTQTLCRRNGVDAALPAFLATAAVNIPSSVFQDRCFTQWYGAARTGRFHVVTYGLWAMRDMATVLGSFTLPGILAKRIETSTGATPERARRGAQLLVPSSVALIVHPPLHLLAIDLYNRPTLSLTERFPLLGSLMSRTAALRFARIMPAFGLGGVINRVVRDACASAP